MTADLDNDVSHSIGNFWEVFLEDKRWSKQTSHIWESYQKYENAEKKERLSKLQELENPEDICDQENLHKAKSEKLLEINMLESEL
ncbi:BgtAc-30490 [Blumeria graminis f. sp. tritici]|uniref:BgtAc-30490 n=2 Tax=Blumeria graminis f. sp. tritici TaxID=62690 RepID=A0A9X9PRX5_BLUGR|nr:hypothetical protein BGT96224_Ac30490 [Blumeria graminis f. sp. tritici 96224]VCU40236.1 BgtAc-30490 [Blumeria graminis f. sp. tritici]